MLLNLSRRAKCAYVVLARFASKYDAQSYPRAELIAGQLGFRPYNTDATTGRARTNLSVKQRRTRKAQWERFNAEVGLAIQECVNANLITLTTYFDRRTRRNVRAYQFLRADGQERTEECGFLSDPFVMIPASFVDNRFFTLRSGSRRDRCPSDRAMSVMLLALRDNDELRYGGIDPHQVAIFNDSIQCWGGTWCAELDMTEQCRAEALLELLRLGYVNAAIVVAHVRDLHLIRENEPRANAPDEVDVMLLRVNA